jgi:outer membrane protein assembly factor BamB
MGGSTRNVITHVVVTPTGRVYAQAAELWAIENGRQLWHWNDAVLKEAPIVDVDGTVFVRDERGAIYAISPTGALRWSWQPEAQAGGEAPGGAMWLAGERSLVASVGRRLAVLDLGRRVALPAPAAPATP